MEGAMTHAKKKFVAEIVAGETIQEIFVLAEKNTGQRRDGKPFLNVVLADKSGQIKGVIWDHVEEVAPIAAGCFVKIQATAGEYRGALQLVVKSMGVVTEEGVTLSDYLPATARNVEQMFARLQALTDTLSSAPLKALAGAFWADAEFVQRFKQSPAAKHMHHAYIGGLLEHTLSMALLVDKIAGHYGGIDRDILLLGAVLHDIGKVRELYFDCRIDYTDEGRLLSHIIIGLEMVESKIRAIDGFPPKQAALIKHMIVSHHGSREFGSPEPPKTIEAVLLNCIDEMDARVNGIREFMASEDPSATWTSFHRLLERHFYKGETPRN